MVHFSHFSNSELYLNDMQASKILDFFGFTTTGTVITTKDREFAQALLVEAIDASRSLWYIQTLYKSATKPRSSVERIINAFARKSLMKWFKSRFAWTNENVPIYDSVRNTTRWKASAVWHMRQNGLEMIW